MADPGEPEHGRSRYAGTEESGHVEQPANARWPDKVLYGTMLLYVVAALGVLTALLQMTTGLGIAGNGPAFFAVVSPWYIATFSVFTGLFAYMAVTQRSTGFSLLAAVFGILSIGFYGVNTLLSAIAMGLVFVPRSAQVGTGMTRNKVTGKALSASLLMLAAGVVTLVWGVAVGFGAVGFEPYIQPAWLFGALSALIGLLAIGSAWSLALGKGQDVAIAVGVLVILTFSLYVVGPALALGAIGFAFLERREERRGVLMRG